MAEVAQDDLADILRHVHWNKAKAKHIRESAGIIVRRHHGVVPRRRAELLALPGVGPALVEILLNVFDSWDEDDKASVAAAEASSPEARAVVGGGNRDGDVDGVEGDGGDGSGGGDGAAVTVAAVVTAVVAAVTVAGLVSAAKVRTMTTKRAAREEDCQELGACRQRARASLWT
ncbi:unnamed protein product [Ectocarpus sp. 13 AM-2016]